MALNLFLAQFPVTAAAAWMIEAVPLTPGNYYIRATAAGESLIAEAQTKVQIVFADVTIALASDGSYRIKFANSGGADRSVDLGASLMAAFGFAASPVVVPAGGSVTGTKQAPAAWLPNVEPSDFACLLGAAGKPIYDSVVAIAPSGAHVRTTGPTRYECPMRFYALAARKLWQSVEVVVNESWQRFYEGQILARHPSVRWFADIIDADPTQTFACASDAWKADETIKNLQAYWTLDLLWIPA